MKRVFIIGGTKGIGAALAQLYVSKGWEVGICGRSSDVEAISKAIKLFQVDVRNLTALQAAIQNFKANSTLDLLINCAGYYVDDVERRISSQEMELLLQTNLTGAMHTFECARKMMINQNMGQVAIIASISGTLDFPNSSLYSKAKRAVIQIAATYRRAFLPYHIGVTVIAPGYVDTLKLRELNGGDLTKKPFVIAAEDAAERIFEAIAKRKELAVFPKRMQYLMWLLGLLPHTLLNRFMVKKAKWMRNE